MQDAAIELVCGDIDNHLHDMNCMLNNVIIFPHIRNTRKINDIIVQKMESRVVLF